MPFSLSHLSKRSLLALGLILVITLTTLAFGLRTLNRTSAAVTPSVASVQAKRLNALRFKISSRGVEPSELKITPGRYLVAVDNDVDLKETLLSIDKDQAGKVRDVKIDLGRRKFKDYVEFTPGVYTLSDPTNPKRLSRITVTTDTGGK